MNVTRDESLPAERGQSLVSATLCLSLFMESLFKCVHVPITAIRDVVEGSGMSDGQHESTLCDSSSS